MKPAVAANRPKGFALTQDDGGGTALIVDRGRTGKRTAG